MEITETYYPKNREEWRNWLAENHQSKTEIWMITPRKDTKKPRVSYDDAVEEALCFGWIDGIAKTFDEDSSAQRYTPRKKKSFLSELNRQRIWKLQKLDLMTLAGIEPIKDQIGSPDDEFVIPPSILAQLQQDKQTWENFQNFPKNYQRLRIGFVLECIKQNPTESQKRLNNLLKMTAQNKMYGTIVAF
jgi:uncharacterized protein YdeI (YjbR/CyaY-like superfamily)